MRTIFRALPIVVLSAAAFAQTPLIYTRGVLNAGSFIQPGLPSGSIAQGSLFSIFGTRLGPASSPTLAFPLSTTLGGVSISVTQGATTVAAIPVFVGPGQINAIMPSNTPLGAVSLRVTFNNNRGAPTPANIVAASFGIFTLNSAGFGPGVMQNFVSQTQTPINTPLAAAQPGQTIIMYGTGLGPALNSDNVAPTAGTLSTPVEVFVGGQLASVAYSGRSPCCSGLDQIVFTVPANAPQGCWVPVQVRTNRAAVSNTVTMAIGPSSTCSDSANALSSAFLTGKKIGLVALLRTDVTEDVGLPVPGNVTTDSAMVAFQQESPTPLPPFNPFFSLPPPGTCTAYTAVGDLFDADSFPLGGTTGKFLSAGATLSLQNPSSVTRSIKRPSTNERNFQPIGFTFTGSTASSSLFLNPGNFTLSGPGGSDVGSFQAVVTIPTPLTWTNRDQAGVIVRAQGFTVNWSGAPSGQSVVIFGGGVDTPANATSEFVCVASAGATSFTIPAAALGNIPATHTNLLQSKGVIYVGALPISNPTSFSASGLDVGAILTGGFAGKTVIFQ